MAAEPVERQRFPAPRFEKSAPRRTGIGLEPHRTAAPAALRAFCDGFGGALAGGLLYCVAVRYLYPSGLEYAGMRVLLLSALFGGFEMWRVARRRTLVGVRSNMIWVLVAGIIAWWGMGAMFHR